MIFKKPSKEAVFNLWRKNLTNFKRGPGFSALKFQSIFFPGVRERMGHRLIPITGRFINNTHLGEKANFRL